MMYKIIIFFTFLSVFNLCLCVGQPSKGDFVFKKTTVFCDNSILLSSLKTSKYLNITNKIVNELSQELDFEIKDSRDSSDIIILVKYVNDDLIFRNSKIFLYFKRNFEEKPIEGFIYNIPTSYLEDTLSEYKTLYKPFRICLSLITANLNVKNYNYNLSPKYWVNLRFENKSNIDTITFERLRQMIERIFYFHQKEFDFQCVEKLEQAMNNSILIDIKVESIKEQNDDIEVILSYKSKDIIFDGSKVLFNKSFIGRDNIFKILTFLNREIKSSILKFY